MRTLQGFHIRLIVAGGLEGFETHRVPDDGLQVVDFKAGGLQVIKDPGNHRIA